MNLIIYLFYFVCIGLSADFLMTKPADNGWVVMPPDPQYKYPINGTYKGNCENCDVIITTNGASYKTKLKDGKFSTTIEADSFKENSQHKINSKIYSNNKIVAENTGHYYCCSLTPGIVANLKKNQKQDIRVNVSGSELNGVKISIPEKLILKDQDIYITQQQAEGINWKYVPLSSPVTVHFKGDVVENKPVKISIPFDLKTPRMRDAKKTSVKDWENFKNQKWRDIDIKKDKILVIAYDSGFWLEIQPTSITQNSVEFDYLPYSYYEMLVPVAIRQD